MNGLKPANAGPAKARSRTEIGTSFFSMASLDPPAPASGSELRERARKILRGFNVWNRTDSAREHDSVHRAEVIERIREVRFIRYKGGQATRLDRDVPYANGNVWASR